MISKRKLKEDIMSIILIVINKRLLCNLSVILFVVNGYAQKKTLSIELELVDVLKYHTHLNSQGGIKGDEVPDRINFEFFVYNHTAKQLLFGSNTCHYYQPDWDNSDYGEIGRFLMINGTDTIALFTQYSSLVPIPSNTRDTVAYWASIEGVESSAFIPFLHYWRNMKNDWVESLYSYLKACRFVYVPIQADYQRRLNKFKNKSMIDCIIYPHDVIEIKKKEPFLIIISDYDSQEDYYVYPLMFKDDD